MPDALKIENLSHHYGTKTVFSNLSLTLQKGQCMSILGQSGCGKTTLIRDIAGLGNPSSGHITIYDRRVVENGRGLVAPENRGVGMVFQDYALFPNMTVAENIAFGLTNKSEAKARTNELMTLAAIPELADRFPAELSGGQQQRVALIRALAPKPKLLLLDEPFANVDAHRKTQLGQALRHILRQEQASAIFITHDQTDALALSDQLAVMTMTANEATVAQVDSPEAVYLHPVSPTVARLTGATQFIHTHAADSQVKLFGQLLPLAQPLSGAITLLIRPEQLEFIEDDSGAMSVTRVDFQGAQRQLQCTHPDGTIKVHHHVRITSGTRGYVKARMPLFAWPEHVLTTPKV